MVDVGHAGVADEAVGGPGGAVPSLPPRRERGARAAAEERQAGERAEKQLLRGSQNLPAALAAPPPPPLLLLRGAPARPPRRTARSARGPRRPLEGRCSRQRRRQQPAPGALLLPLRRRPLTLPPPPLNAAPLSPLKLTLTVSSSSGVLPTPAAATTTGLGPLLEEQPWDQKEKRHGGGCRGSAQRGQRSGRATLNEIGGGERVGDEKQPRVSRLVEERREHPADAQDGRRGDGERRGQREEELGEQAAGGREAASSSSVDAATSLGSLASRLPPPPPPLPTRVTAPHHPQLKARAGLPVSPGRGDGDSGVAGPAVELLWDRRGGGGGARWRRRRAFAAASSCCCFAGIANVLFFFSVLSSPSRNCEFLERLFFVFFPRAKQQTRSTSRHCRRKKEQRERKGKRESREKERAIGEIERR